MTYGIGVVAVALMALAGGPGDRDEGRLSKQAYEQKVRGLYAGVQSAFRATHGVAGKELAGKIALAQKALRRAAGALLATRPPQDVEADNRSLAGAMRAYAVTLDTARQAAEQGSEQTLAAFQDASRNMAVRQMTEAAERMKRRGYDLGAIAEE